MVTSLSERVQGGIDDFADRCVGVDSHTGKSANPGERDRIKNVASCVFQDLQHDGEDSRVRDAALIQLSLATLDLNGSETVDQLVSLMQRIVETGRCRVAEVDRELLAAERMVSPEYKVALTQRVAHAWKMEDAKPAEVYRLIRDLVARHFAKQSDQRAA